MRITANLSIEEIEQSVTSMESTDPDFLFSLATDHRFKVRRIASRLLAKGESLESNEEIFRRGEVVHLAGADEAGRGSLAGPLVAAAVMFPPGTTVDEVDDSKALSPEKRESLYHEIISSAMSISVVYVDSGFIDRWGLSVSNLKALGDAINGIDSRCQFALCDHLSPRGCGVTTCGIPAADATFHSVAAASIVAKVERDSLMRFLHRYYSRYNFRANKGYGTREHLRALKVHGPSHIHRRSFHGVGPRLFDTLGPDPDAT